MVLYRSTRVSVVAKLSLILMSSLLKYKATCEQAHNYDIILFIAISQLDIPSTGVPPL